MTKLIGILVKKGKINEDMALKVKNYLSETKAPSTGMLYLHFILYRQGQVELTPTVL